MPWRITWNPDYKTRSGIEGRHEIKSEDGSVMKGDITRQLIREGVYRYDVALLMVPDLAYSTDNRDRALGYVRGVEAAVNLYAKETGLAA